MGGSSGKGPDVSEEGPDEDACNVVKNSEGKEKQVMDFMRENQNNATWFPGLNDCHNAAKDAVEDAGLVYPGAPGDRLDGRGGDVGLLDRIKPVGQVNVK